MINVLCSRGTGRIIGDPGERRAPIAQMLTRLQTNLVVLKEIGRHGKASLKGFAQPEWDLSVLLNTG